MTRPVSSSRDPKDLIDDLLERLRSGPAPATEEITQVLTLARKSLGVLSSHAAHVASRGIGIAQRTLPGQQRLEDWQIFIEGLDAEAKIMAVAAIQQAGMPRDRRSTQSINQTLTGSPRPSAE